MTAGPGRPRIYTDEERLARAAVAQRRYYERHRGRCIDYRRAYYETHHDEILAQHAIDRERARKAALK